MDSKSNKNIANKVLRIFKNQQIFFISFKNKLIISLLFQLVRLETYAKIEIYTPTKDVSVLYD